MRRVSFNHDIISHQNSSIYVDTPTVKEQLEDFKKYNLLKIKPSDVKNKHNI
jgi:hypothetical protein